MPTATASLDLRMPSAIAYQRWALFRGLAKEAATTHLEVLDAVDGKHVAWRIRDLRRRSGLATFESLPEGGTRVYLQMGAGDDGDRRTVLARMTDELTQQLAAFKSFAEELARGRQLLAAPSMSGTTLRSGRILDRRRSGAA